MTLGAVFRSCYCGDATLCPAAGGVAAGVAVQQKHLQLSRQLKAGHQPCCPCADHHDIPGTVRNGRGWVRETHETYKKAAGCTDGLRLS